MVAAWHLVAGGDLLETLEDGRSASSVFVYCDVFPRRGVGCCDAVDWGIGVSFVDAQGEKALRVLLHDERGGVGVCRLHVADVGVGDDALVSWQQDRLDT